MESHPCSVNQIDIWAIWVIIVTLPRRRLGHCWLHTQSLCGRKRDATVFDVQGRGSKNNPSGTTHPQIAQRVTGPCVRLDFTPLVFSREIPL